MYTIFSTSYICSQIFYPRHKHISKRKLIRAYTDNSQSISTANFSHSCYYIPVEAPQARRQALLGGIAGSIFITLARWTTVYSAKLDTNMKWCKVSPLRSLNLLVPSCIQGSILNGNLVHRLLFLDLQSVHSAHSDMKIGITMSPSTTSATPSPTLSTTLQVQAESFSYFNAYISENFTRILWDLAILTNTNFNSQKLQIPQNFTKHYISSHIYNHIIW